MTIAGVLFFIVFFGTMLSKIKEEAVLDIPVTEVLHDEKRIPLFDTFKPWLVTMAIILVLAYVPAFIDATKNPGPGAPQFLPESPVPVEAEAPANTIKLTTADQKPIAKN
jgi:cytochrome c oxidase subunit 1